MKKIPKNKTSGIRNAVFTSVPYDGKLSTKMLEEILDKVMQSTPPMHMTCGLGALLAIDNKEQMIDTLECEYIEWISGYDTLVRVKEHVAKLGIDVEKYFPKPKKIS